MPVKTIRASRGSSRLTFFRLCSRAPRMTSLSEPFWGVEAIASMLNDALVILIPDLRGLAYPACAEKGYRTGIQGGMRAEEGDGWEQTKHRRYWRWTPTSR